MPVQPADPPNKTPPDGPAAGRRTPEPSTVDRLYRIEEAADLLRLSRSTIYLEIDDGRIPVCKARGSTRIKGSDLQAYIDSLEAK